MLAAAVDAGWTLAPGPIALVLILGGTYGYRFRAARRQTGSRGAPASRAVVFALGLLCLAGALISPLDRLGEQVFAMHMVQHVLLLDLAAALLILGTTKVILRPATRRLRDLERAAGPLAHPAFAVAFYVLVMYVWHIPALYDAALENAFVHVLEHVLFTSAGLLYWWHLLSPIRSREFRGLQPVVYMAATKVFVGLLGILLTFAPDALYAFYEDGPRYWGLSPEEDQAMAGAIMAVEQSIVMGVAIAYLFVRALGESEKDEERRERYEVS